MGKYDTQRAAHAFLLDHFLSGRTFTLDEFRRATGWDKAGTLNTYLRKQYRGLIENIEGGPLISEKGHYRVTESFRDLIEWRSFRQHVTQVRVVLKEHARVRSKVLIYEFLMPLTHETALRTTLDNLFYEDTLIRKMRAIHPDVLGRCFSKRSDQSTEDHLNQIMDFIGAHFVGYSISHVDGRFRAVGILPYEDVAVLLKSERRYLIDETTAVTRFIFPYNTDEELDKLRFLFHELFVKSMIVLAKDEQQVWMIESGPEQRVHIWQAEDDDDESEQPEEV
jgi:hypothetical protein